MPTVEENISSVHERIKQQADLSGRQHGSVSLLAVSKKRSPEEVKLAQQAGQTDFGENYLQEAEEKIQALDDPFICWHLIGPLQSNKCKSAAKLFNWVHTVDRLKIAQRLATARSESFPGNPLNVCIQVNISNEANKSGVGFNEAEQLALQIASLQGLTLRGYMGIAENTPDKNQIRSSFDRLHQLFCKTQRMHSNIDTLSMGMSADLELAIDCGSTMVRIGTDIFGQRS